LRSDKDVYVFWDYEYEIVFRNMIWWILMPAAIVIFSWYSDCNITDN
jgi:hypothetical protein